MKATTIKKLLWLVFYSLPLVAFSANLTEPRAEVSPPQPLPEASLPVKVIINMGREEQPEGLPEVPAGTARARSAKYNAQAVKAYVENQALKFGVNPGLAIWIVKHESQFNPRAKGDGEASRGLWQISRVYHPEVSDTAAFSVAASTEWSLNRIRSGKAYEWSTYRFCRTLYKDCPF